VTIPEESNQPNPEPPALPPAVLVKLRAAAAKNAMTPSADTTGDVARDAAIAKLRPLQADLKRAAALSNTFANVKSMTQLPASLARLATIPASPGL